MTHHVSKLTKITGAKDGCLGCGKVVSEDELDERRCNRCGVRCFTLVEFHWYVDKFGTHVPNPVIDFSKKGALT